MAATRERVVYVKRNTRGRITGVYSEPKEGKAEEKLPSNHPSVEDYRKRNKALLANPSPDPEAEMVRLRARLERLETQAAIERARKRTNKGA